MQNVRFIAINDGVDSAKGDDDFTPVRSLFNDFYAKDTSRKVRTVLQAKGKSGQHLNRPMYGYREAPDAKGKWIIDEEYAPVVKRMFDLAMEGKGSRQIANILCRLRNKAVLPRKSQRENQQGQLLLWEV